MKAVPHIVIIDDENDKPMTELEKEKLKQWYDKIILSQVDLSDRCTGHCCRKFFLPLSPMELEKHKRRAMVKKSKFKPEEIIKIANMAVFLHQRQDVFLHRDKVKRSFRDSAWGYYYTCRHFDGKNCTDYENRPDMCRNYPYGHRCEYPKCTCISYRHPYRKHVVGSRLAFAEEELLEEVIEEGSEVKA